MGTPYSPSPVRLEDITLLDDGDVFDAGNLNTPVEAIADGVEYLNKNAFYLASATYTSSQSITVPEGATHMFYVGCGGGGGGGGGGPAAGSDRTCAGGGGGGGALLCVGLLQVTAGEELALTIGAGGAGGAAATIGSNGGDTTIVRTSGSITLATMMGGEGGAGGTNTNTPRYLSNNLDANDSSGSLYVIARGGHPVRRLATSQAEVVRSALNVLPDATPSKGGDGIGGNYSNPGLRSGNSSPQGYQGGLRGTTGVPATTYPGGGGGGGGGGGPYGGGAAGGNGGAANSSGAATNGSAGSAASNNTGAGGGGGGASGSSNTLTGTGGAGAAGGSGRLTLAFLRKEDA